MYSFYRFPTDPDRRRRWVSFVSRQNPNGTLWQPGEGDRICSEHFISKKKSDMPGNPNYVPSVYPEVTAKKKCSGNSNSNATESLARFERAQRRAAANEKERIAKEMEEERICLFTQQAVRGFKHDHGGYCKSKSCGIPCETAALVPATVSSSSSMQASQITEGSLSSNIPAEIGRYFTTFHNYNDLLTFYFRVSD